MFRFALLIALTACFVGCEDPCPGGQCPPEQQQPNPFSDYSNDYISPSGNRIQIDDWSQSRGSEVFASPATFVNHKAAAETKSGCPCNAPVVSPQAPVVSQPTTVPWQTHRMILPPIRLNPGEVLQRVFAPRIVSPQVTTVQPPRTMPVPDAISKPLANCDTCCDRDCDNCQCPPGCNCDKVSEDIREGAFVCQVCKSPTVGEDWHELWADDDTPLTCVCKSCWQRLSPRQRAIELIQYAKGALKGDLSPIVTAAIKEAAIQ